MSAADGIVLPKPQIPKTLGILNIIFGVLLILLGTCMLGIQMSAPLFRSFAEKAAAQQNRAIASQRQAELKAKEDEEKAATDDAAKAKIKADREALAKAPMVTPIQPDMSGLDTLNKPTVRNAMLLEKGSGLAMNVALVVAGIGLVRLREWGRSLGVWLAGLQIARLALVTIGYLAFVLPVQRADTERLLAKMEADMDAGKGAPNAAAAVPMARAMSSLTLFWWVGYGVLGMIYPAVSLGLLTTRGARAACHPGGAPEPESPADPFGAPL